MREKLVMAGYESSGVANLIKEQSFDTFSLDYYARNKETYERMSHVYRVMREYADGFSSEKCDNILMIGGTGLGKTHLSTAIAKTVIDKIFDVLYVTATGMMGDFEYKRFGNAAFDGDAGDTSRYYTADLLIIDDLGTEMTNQFTVSCLYNVINSRLNKGKTVIINTNLTRDELKKRYSDRITSRLFGEFLPVMFVGRDMRELKLD